MNERIEKRHVRKKNKEILGNNRMMIVIILIIMKWKMKNKIGKQCREKQENTERGRE